MVKPTPDRQANRLAQRAARLTPFRQGQFDSLCGLYAILNALRLATDPPLPNMKAQGLFGSAIAYLRREYRHLNPTNHGMSNELMLELAELMTARATTDTRCYELFACPETDPAQPDAFSAWINAMLARDRPIIVGLIRPSHFSVLVNRTPGGLILFDSRDLGWVPLVEGQSLLDILDPEGVAMVRVS